MVVEIALLEWVEPCHQVVAEELRHQVDLVAQADQVARVEVEEVAHLVLVAESFRGAEAAEELHLKAKALQELNSILEVGAELAKEELNLDFDLLFGR